jgi:hypothetical protein
MSESASKIDNNRLRYAYLIALVGILVSAIIALYLVTLGWKSSSDIVAIVGLFTSVTGTIVGAFFGMQIGSAGKEAEREISSDILAKEREDREKFQTIALRALSLLEPKDASKILKFESYTPQESSKTTSSNSDKSESITSKKKNQDTDYEVEI